MKAQILTIPEVSAHLGISRYTLYLRIKANRVPAFRALYETGPYRLLASGPGRAPRPLPHFHRRPPAGVTWGTTAEVARTLRVSARIVQAACVAGVLETRLRYPGASLRPRYEVALDAATGLPLPAGTLVPVRAERPSTKRR